MTDDIQILPCDREAYIALFGGKTFPTSLYREAIMRGEWDEVAELRIIARHRIAGVKAGLEAAANKCLETGERQALNNAGACCVAIRRIDPATIAPKSAPTPS